MRSRTGVYFVAQDELSWVPGGGGAELGAECAGAAWRESREEADGERVAAGMMSPLAYRLSRIRAYASSPRSRILRVGRLDARFGRPPDTVNTGFQLFLSPFFVQPV
jgi:hypothetical protein